ncbi:MAG: argininosuccinate synthase [bacterium]
MMKSKRKIVLAYSGGLDTSIIIHWLKQKYDADVIAVCIDVGQGQELNGLKQKALKSGASKAYIINAAKEFVVDYIFPCIKAGAVYENKYFLGTSIARPIIAKKVVEVARKEDAWALSHGATGKGNDQVRFELVFKALAPELKIIAPWREWELKSRKDEIEYAKRFKIPVAITKEKPYSSDKNIWHISYEGGILEDTANHPKEDMFELTVSPEKAPDKPEIIEIGFKKGIPVTLNNKLLDPVVLLHTLNKIGGRNGIGRVDLVENRLVGMKSRGVYESPAAAILYTAHNELENLVLDRDSFRMKQYLSVKYSELVYYGLWHSTLREALDKFFGVLQENVEGVVKLKLYKGNCIIYGRESKKSLYWQELATFEEDNLFNQYDAEGFINLFGLPTKIAALKRKDRRM